METTEVLIIGAGQSGLAAAHAARVRGLETLIIDATESTAGSWPRYYDSLRLFSPARYSSLAGARMKGGPGRYPHRDEVVAYLQAYGEQFSDELRLGERVNSVEFDPAGGFTATTEKGSTYQSRALIAATGQFGRPYRPRLAGLEDFQGQVIHSAEYVSPRGFSGSRVVVVGAGNSAIQIAADLVADSKVTVASRSKVRWKNQRWLGRDIHWWLTRSGFDTVSVPRLLHRLPVSVIDDGRYRSAIKHGEFDLRPMFRRADRTGVTWNGGDREPVDSVILATGYQPDLGYLSGLGALAPDGSPHHRGGVSTTVPGLGFVGLEFQRSFSSNTLRGCGRDAAFVIDHLQTRLAAVARPGTRSNPREGQPLIG